MTDTLPVLRCATAVHRCCLALLMVGAAAIWMASRLGTQTISPVVAYSAMAALAVLAMLAWVVRKLGQMVENMPPQEGPC